MLCYSILKVGIYYNHSKGPLGSPPFSDLYLRDHEFFHVVIDSRSSPQIMRLEVKEAEGKSCAVIARH